MTSTQDVLDAARQLGALIGQHPATQTLDGLLERLDGDTDAQRLMTDLNRHRETLAQKQAQGQPIEVDDKRKLETLQQGVAAHALLGELQMAQMDYVDLMRKVDQEIGASAPKP